MKKNGRQYSFTAEEFPEDFDDSYTFIKREDKIVRKGTAIPAIRDFSLQTLSGNDTTLQLLTEPGAKLFLFLKDGYKKGDWLAVMDMIMQKAEDKGIKGFLVTNLEVRPDTAGDLQKNPAALVRGLIPLRTDGTAIKTAARYNPTLFLIDGGTIIEKWSAPDLDRAFKEISGSKLK